MEIIIISTMNFRNKNLRPVVNGFLKKYPKVDEELKKISNGNNENEVITLDDNKISTSYYRKRSC